MSLYIASLNSGSNGNCYYVGNDDHAVLVDAGLSCREFDKRMLRLGLDVGRIRAIVISHEHSDHIFGLQTLAKKYQLPVYITAPTCAGSGLKIPSHLVREFSPHQEIQFGNISVLAFPKFHDACDPHSFLVRSASVTIGVFTDIGRVCQTVIDHFELCNAAFLEANYDEQMLARGRYPHHLKNRIRGGKGHLSNMQALELFLSHRPAFMSHLVLSHLSKENNHPELVQQLFMQHAGRAEIVIASRHEETSVLKIEPAASIPFVLPKPRKNRQLTLF
jgi:phosphoribosyl 1,2-cyclic phosphodiesterase